MRTWPLGHKQAAPGNALSSPKAYTDAPTGTMLASDGFIMPVTSAASHIQRGGGLSARCPPLSAQPVQHGSLSPSAACGCSTSGIRGKRMRLSATSPSSSACANPSRSHFVDARAAVRKTARRRSVGPLAAMAPETPSDPARVPDKNFSLSGEGQRAARAPPGLTCRIRLGTLLSPSPSPHRGTRSHRLDLRHPGAG